MISIFGIFLKKDENDAIFVFFNEKYAWKNFRIWPYATKYFLKKMF